MVCVTNSILDWVMKSEVNHNLARHITPSKARHILTPAHANTKVRIIRILVTCDNNLFPDIITYIIVYSDCKMLPVSFMLSKW